MIKISKLLADLAKNGKKAFIPYITAGDPDTEKTKELVKTLSKNGAEILELGVPFSDPGADGEVNQRSAERALKNNTSLLDVLALVEELRKEECPIPIVIFSYFNPILRLGIENFCQKAKSAGVNAVLVVDLPPEEAEEYKEILDRYELETIFLAAPTTSEIRLQLIDKMSTAFVYYVARKGVTGIQSEIAEDLGENILRLKKKLKNKVCVGFGISTPQQAKTIANFADGVIVGSALVKLIEDNLQKPENISPKIAEFTKEMTKAIKE